MQDKQKTNYRFTVDNSSEANPIDWYSAYLEVDFKLVTLADSDTGITAGTANVNQFLHNNKWPNIHQRNRS